MRVNNKKYLVIILLVVVILTGVILFKPKQEVKLDNVILKQEVNNKTFAMYKEEGKSYVPVEGNKFPEAYVLNLNESRCIDNNGNEIKDALSYENDEVVLTTNKSSYCYLYFDKSLGLEIKEKTPNGLKIDKVRGSMYRFQGQARDENGNELVDNYICFGTSDKDKCTIDTDHYMYRIIGIEAETGRVKVIKKEALNQPYQWNTDYHTDIKFVDSIFFKAINDKDFLTNKLYVPNGWEEKIANNNWTYGYFGEGSTTGLNQTGEGLFKVETGQKETSWQIKSTQEDGGIPYDVVWTGNNRYPAGTTLYYKDVTGVWTDNINVKISLMYMHDYYYSVSDIANCQYNVDKYEECRTGWIHLSNNDPNNMNKDEWNMSILGWWPWSGVYRAVTIYEEGFTNGDEAGMTGLCSIRPVFYLTSVNQLSGGSGTITDPFLITE